MLSNAVGFVLSLEHKRGDLSAADSAAGTGLLGRKDGLGRAETQSHLEVGFVSGLGWGLSKQSLGCCDNTRAPQVLRGSHGSSLQEALPKQRPAGVKVGPAEPVGSRAFHAHACTGGGLVHRGCSR